MYKKAILLILLFLTWANATDITKAAISKLIDRSYMLEKRVKFLEKKVAILSKNEIILKAKKESVLENTFYIPSKSGFIRKAPYKRSKAVAIANKKIQISKIFCSNRHNVFWGKSNRGWIYISNPRYGTIVDSNSKIIEEQTRTKWCGM